MKKTISIFFLFIFLSANTEAHQLFKLPILLHHYFDHKKSEPTISFSEFMHKHYSNDVVKTTHTHQKNHTNEHTKLPFKSHDCSVVHSSIIYSTAFNFMFKYQVPVTANNGISYCERFQPASILASIWQPPKFFI